jgi:hypothetical protein
VPIRVLRASYYRIKVEEVRRERKVLYFQPTLELEVLVLDLGSCSLLLMNLCEIIGCVQCYVDMFRVPAAPKAAMSSPRYTAQFGLCRCLASTSTHVVCGMWYIPWSSRRQL